MGVGLDVTGINHQPFQIAIIADKAQQTFKYPKIAPAEEPVGHALLVAVFRR